MTAHTDADDLDIIMPRNHAVTEKIVAQNPWLTISPDEQTLPQRSMSEDPEQPTCAALIRMVSLVFEQQSSASKN